jgi:hypothetical protein
MEDNETVFSVDCALPQVRQSKLTIRTNYPEMFHHQTTFTHVITAAAAGLSSLSPRLSPNNITPIWDNYLWQLQLRFLNGHYLVGA